MKVPRTVWAGGKDGDYFRSLTYLHLFWRLKMLECPSCKSQNVRPHSGATMLIVGLVMFIVGVAFGKGPGEVSQGQDPIFLYAFLGIASAFGLVITIMAICGMLFGKHTCKDCKNKWR